MLVLTLKKNETLQIGDDVAVTVIAISPGRVLLGVAAPPELKITRPGVVSPPKTGTRPA